LEKKLFEKKLKTIKSLKKSIQKYKIIERTISADVDNSIHYSVLRI